MTSCAIAMSARSACLWMNSKPVSYTHLDVYKRQTETRAKALRSFAEPIITWAKKGDLHSRRLAIAKLGDKQLVAELFDKAAQGMWADRNGGYTRIMKLGRRKGDNA